MSPRKIRLLIELDPTGDLMAGTMQHLPHGAPQPFKGWLQLTELLETIRKPPDDPEPTQVD